MSVTTMPTAATSPDRSYRRWRRTIRVIKVLMVLWVAIAVWIIGFRDDNAAAPLLPDTEPQFSLDLEVIGTADHPVIYAVEQRARPFYRIFALDASAGTVETVFTVPEDALIYGMALSPDESTLAVAYTPDFHNPGSGIWLLDLDTGKLTEAAAEQPDIYLADLEWDEDMQTVFATQVDKTGTKDQVAVAAIDIDTGDRTIIAYDAIAPTIVEEGLYFLQLDDNFARRTIGLLNSDTTIDTLAVGDGRLDLNHLIDGDQTSTLRVTAIELPTTTGLTIGEPASAHGNHNVPATWWTVDHTDGSPPHSVATALSPTVVYDAATTGPAIVYATREGLSIADNATRIDLIASRAIRFVAT